LLPAVAASSWGILNNVADSEHAYPAGPRRSLLARSTGAAAAAPAPPRPPAPVVQPRALPAQPPPLARSSEDLPSAIGVLLFGVYLASVSSLSSQIASVYMGLSVPIIGGAFALAALAYLLAGDQLSFFSTRFSIPWVGLLLWWSAASVFGMYPSGSLKFLMGYASRIHVLPLLFMGIAKNARAVRMLMYCFACGYVLVLLYCYKFGTVESGRFFVPDTALANGNDLALHLLFGACFMLIFLRRRFVTRAVWLASMPILAYYVLKTGSRSNMLALVLLFAFALFILPMRDRVKLAIGGAVTLLAIVPLLPRDTLNRLMTFTSIKRNVASYEELDVAKGAVGSTEARSRMQKRAVELTIANPVFGVGPTMFANAMDEMIRQSENRKSSWQVSHNSYLQVSSESGLPALVMYVWAIVLCFKLNYRTYKEGVKSGRSDMSLQALCLLLATATYAFGIFFSSIAFDYHLAVIIGFTAANCRAWQNAGSGETSARRLA
jgi:O-antigen ligase